MVILYRPMNRTLLMAAAMMVSAQSVVSGGISDHGYPISPVPFTSVKVNDTFWSHRLESALTTTIPLAFRKCEESGRYENFIRAASPSESYKVEGFPFDDTDVYKTIEGASYMLQTYPDERMVAYIDSVLAIVAKAQEPDGYLNTSYTMNPKHPHNWMGPGRWDRVEELSHEFYNLGHMCRGFFEMARIVFLKRQKSAHTFKHKKRARSACVKPTALHS